MKGKFAKLFKKVGIAIVFLCIVSYCIFHVSSLVSEEIGTIVVGPTVERETVSISGYIFRDATPMYSDKYSGAVDYLVKNGQKVAVNDELAIVYSEGNRRDVASWLSIIDEQIDLLRISADKKPSVSEITELRANASNAYYSIMKRLASGSDISISADQKKLLVALNSIAILTEEDFDIKATLEQLTYARETLIASGGESETLITDKSGYFYTVVDGYEGTFTSEAAQTLSRDEFVSLFERASEEQKRDTGDCIGKMSYNSTWYFAATMPAEQAEHFSENKRYTVSFTSGDHFEIDMDVCRILPDEEGGDTVIVFVSNVLPEGFNFRTQTAKIVTNSVKGIYVPKIAVHRKNYSDVVYILKGSVVKLRYIDIIYEGSDYYLVRESVQTEKGDDRIFLSSNEQLIVKGSNLFDGRILG